MVIESTEYEVTISEHLWTTDADDEAAQQSLNMEAMREFLDRIIAYFKSAPLSPKFATSCRRNELIEGFAGSSCGGAGRWFLPCVAHDGSAAFDFIVEFLRGSARFRRNVLEKPPVARMVRGDGLIPRQQSRIRPFLAEKGEELFAEAQLKENRGRIAPVVRDVRRGRKVQQCGKSLMQRPGAESPVIFVGKKKGLLQGFDVCSSGSPFQTAKSLPCGLGFTQYVTLKTGKMHTGPVIVRGVS